MGYEMMLMESDFRIRKENHNAALRAVKALQGKETIHIGAGAPHFRWVTTEEFVNAKTLEKAFRAWNWSLEIDERGDAILFDFLGRKRGDEIILFNAVAPYVEPNAYIQMVGEDGVIWRWWFDGSTATVHFGRVLFDDLAKDLILSRIDSGDLVDWQR